MTHEPLSPEDLRSLYKELILDHARNPRNFGRPDAVTHEADGINRLCGDKLTLFLRIDDHRIRDAHFEGTGCAISVASASLLTEAVKGVEERDALALGEALVSRLKSGDADAGIDLGKLRALEGVREFPSRVKCATLAWHALNSAINKDEAPASTE